MTRISILAVLCMLAGCERPQHRTQATLEADPARLHALHQQCNGGGHDEALCAQVDQVELQRFLSGQSRVDEYRTLGDLPSIPASFDEPERAQP